MVHALAGKHLVYHSAPFEKDLELSGFFRLAVWLALDQPDTDIKAWVYEIGLDGSSLLLSEDWIRARHRESLREENLIRTRDALCYELKRFMFVARRVSKGHRLRLVIGPINSIYSQKNYNSGGVVSAESMRDARTVTVKVFHDPGRPSALYLPIGQTES
jgi:predicted acyl esterase